MIVGTISKISTHQTKNWLTNQTNQIIKPTIDRPIKLPIDQANNQPKTSV